MYMPFKLELFKCLYNGFYMNIEKGLMSATLNLKSLPKFYIQSRQYSFF